MPPHMIAEAVGDTASAQKTQRHSPKGVPAPAPALSINPFGDAFEHALLRLTRAGYSVDIRTFTLGPNDHRRTLAVYLDFGDSMVDWSSRCQAGVPVGFRYRRDDRRGFDFTIYSGNTIQDVSEFTARLLTPRQPADLGAQPALEAHAEWDPLRLPEAEQLWITEHLRPIEAAFATTLFAACAVN